MINCPQIFITSRPESRIRAAFRLPLLKPYTVVILLHDVERKLVDEDIHLYLQTQLAKAVQNRSGVDVSEPWPSDTEIETLVRKAGGLFIFASTTCKFVASDYGDPRELLQLIVELPDNTAHEGSLGVDALYTRILQDNYASIPRNLNITERLQMILGAVVLSFNPLSLHSASILLQVKPELVKSSLRPLHSLLLVPEEATEPIRVFHKSFTDYITTAERCQDSRLRIVPSFHHSQLAIRSLQLMNATLKKNICELLPYTMNLDISDLLQRRKEFIGDALEYACNFWGRHLCLSFLDHDQLGVVIDLLREFMGRHLLSWLEVMSICNELRAAVTALQSVKELLVKV